MPDALSGKLVVVIDDDRLILDAMEGLLRSWGLRTVTGFSDKAALARLADQDGTPDLIISDYSLLDGSTGVDAIQRLRIRFGASIPAILVSGETDPERLREARASGLPLLYKPVSPKTLRAMLNRILQGD